MAEGAEEDLPGSSLIGAGSEPVYDFYCEVCRESGQILEAFGYCVDCGDYLCNMCVKHHTRSRLTLNHEVMDKDHMPKDEPLSFDKCSRYIETKCAIHRGKTVEYYCGDHHLLGCSVCVTMMHTNCKQTQYIPEIPEDFDQSQEFKTFEEHLNEISQKSSDIIRLSSDSITEAGHCYEQTLVAIRQQRKVINALLDELEHACVKEVESAKTNNIELNRSVSEQADEVSENIGKVLSKIENLKRSRKICQLYIAMKEVSSEIKRMSSNLDELENKSHARLFKFEPNPKLEEMYNDIEAFGNIRFTQSDHVSQDKPMEEQTFYRAIRMPDINVGSDKSTPHFRVTGSAVLSRSKCIIVDNFNCTVSLLDTQANKLIFQMKVHSSLWDVCVVSVNEAAVTCPNEKKICLLKVTGALSIEREISVNGRCHGIAYSRGMLVVTYIRPPMIETMDLNGNLIQRIEKGTDGRTLFKYPQYVCINNNDDTIYISDQIADKVTRLTLSGEIMSQYTDDQLTQPYKVCADQRGNVYVVSQTNRTIHMITPDCSKIKILLTEADGMTTNLYSISHCHETNRLFVGMCENKIKVYQLSG